MRGGRQPETFYRILGRGQTASLTLAEGDQSRTYTIEVREAIAGHTVEQSLSVPARQGSPLRLIAPQTVEQPHAAEVARFVSGLKSAVVVASAAVPGADKVAAELVERLKEQGIDARIADEATVYRRPTGNPKSEDPLGDGFHSWHGRQEVIGPPLVVDAPVIVLGGRRSSLFIDALAEQGYLSESLVGQPGKPSRPACNSLLRACTLPTIRCAL